MAGINLATAYLTIVPTIGGVQGSIASALGGASREARQAGEDAGGVFSGGFGKILKAGAIIGVVAGLGAAAGAAFSGTFGAAMQRQTDTVKQSAALGLSPAESAALGKSAGTLYAQNYGDSFGAVTDALGVVKSSLKGLGGDELEGATKKALSYSSAFEVDMTRSVQTVSTLIGSGLVKNSTEAFDVLTAASQRVPAALREDVLDASDEYAQFFNSLGFDASAAFGALTAASDKGVFGIDKTGDAVKEFTIRATDMSTTSTAAFQALGLDAQTMANEILAGGDVAQGATQQIIDGLLGIEDPATQANTAIALFGTPLEDLGVSNIPTFLSSLSGATGGLGDFAGAADEVDAKIGSTAQAKWAGFTRNLENLGASLTTGLLPAFGPVLDGLGGLASGAAAAIDVIATGDFEGGLWGLEEDSPVVGGLLAVRDGLIATKDAGSDFWAGLTMDAGTRAEFEGQLSGVVGFGASVREVFEGIGSAVGPVLRDLFKEVAPIFKEVGATLGPAVIDVFETLKPAVMQLLPVVTDLLPLFNPVSLIFKALLPVLPQIADMIGQLARVIGQFVAGALTSLAPLFQKVVEVINRLIPFISQLVISLLPPLMGLFDKLAPLLDTILSALLPVADALIDALIPAIDALMPIVDRVFTFVADTIKNVVKYISGMIDFIVGVFTGDWEKAWDGIKEIFGAIWDQIKNIVSFAIDVIVEFFTNLIPKLWEILNSFLNTVVGWGVSLLTWLWDGIKSVAGQVWDWFLKVPGFIWDRIVSFAGTIVEYGKSLIGWIKDGIVDGASAIWKFITDLPGEIWNRIVSVKDAILDLGKRFVAWIVEGIKSVANAIWDAITSVLEGGDATAGAAVPGVDPNSPFRLGKRDGGIIQAGPGQMQMRADGGIMYAPLGMIQGVGGPRSDMIPTMLSNGEFVVNARDTARTRPLLELINAGMMASGGFVGVEPAANRLGGDIAWEYARETLDALKASGASSNGQWGPGVTGGFAANTAAAKAFIERTFQGVSSIGGLYGGSVPGSDHPMGKALDVMIANYLSAIGIQNGSRIADWFIQNPNAFGTKYVIWRDRINQGGAWAPYSHPSGNNDTLAHRDHVHISFLTGDGQFSGGVGAAGQDTAKSPWLAPILDKLMPKATPTLASSGYVPTAGVEQWRGLGLQALTAVGNYKGLSLTGYIDRMLNQIRTESSGNPNAINTTDINAQRGDPSIGLLQVIGSTFRNALRGTPFEMLISRGQRDPWASMISSTLYSLGRYGSLDRAWQGKAYDTGGWLMPGTSGVNLLNKPEPVLTPDQWTTAERAMQLATAGGSGTRMNLNVKIDRSDELAVAIARMIEVEVDGTMMSILDYADQAEGSTV